MIKMIIKNNLAVIMLIELIATAYCVSKTYKEQHRLTHVVRRVLQLAFTNTLAHLLLMYTQSERIATVLYCAYFGMSLWLMYYLFRFSLEYIGRDFEAVVKKKLMLLLLGLDSLSIAVNYFTGHLFTLKRVAFWGGELFFKTVKHPLYYTHYALIIMLGAFCMISLFYMSVKAPLFYRRKYLTIAVVLVCIFLFNINSSKFAVDLSIFGYAVECICIYYCAFVYTPQRLLPTTLFSLAQDMSFGLLILDIDGNQLYANKSALQLLDEENPMTDLSGVTLEQWCRRQYLEKQGEFTADKTFYRHSDNEEYFLKIQLQRMIDANKQLQGGYFTIQDCTEEVNRTKQEQYLAHHDSLTGLYNKEYFYAIASKHIEENPDTEFLIICTDIHNFKIINDVFGPNTGDKVLINFAEMLRSTLKGSAVYGRLTNDNFAILMPKSVFKQAELEKHSQDIISHSLLSGTTLPTMNYIGVYEVKSRSIPISVMCARAKMAINSIKGNYSTFVAFYDDELRSSILHEQEIISILDEAISDGQLKMYLQPQMSADGKLLGAEALVRWVHPQKGLIFPNDFIPIFEKNGLISKVDAYIWELACKQLKEWKDEGKTDLYISVNISPKDFYLLNICEIFTELVKKYEINPKSLKLEITETAVAMDINRQLDLISQLRNAGFIVEMDDFGSGYSSLNMLKDIRVDILKIDMRFLTKSDDESRSRKILQMIIELSNQLGMPVITEGVETAEQLSYLSEMGCNMFQGYYFAKPMPVEQFKEMYSL